jgi:hypothetical protein
MHIYDMKQIFTLGRLFRNKPIDTPGYNVFWKRCIFVQRRAQ